MQTEAKKLLFDVLNACEAIEEFTTDKTFADYLANRLLRAGTEREFEIIGEALSRLRRVDQSIADSISSLGQIVDFRNRIIHGYDSVDNAIVWAAVQNDVPILKSEVQALLDNG